MTDPLIADLAPNSFAYYAGGFTMETTEIDSTNVGNYIYNIYDGSSNDISALFTSSFSPSPVMGSPNTITLVSPSLSDGSTIYLQVLNTVTKVQSYTYSILSDATNFTVTQVTDPSTIPTEITDLSITSKTASTITIHSTNLLSSNSNLVYYTDALGTAAKITIEPQNISNGSVTIANAGKGGGARDYDYPLSNLYIRTNGVINSNIISSVSSPQGGAITIVDVGSGQYSFVAVPGYSYQAIEGNGTTVDLDTSPNYTYTYTLSDTTASTTLTIIGTDANSNQLSGTVTYTLGGGGGGSGDGGGTYPNNNYNNMSAIHWSTVYDANASQTVTVTVAGETSPGMTADYTINVADVSLADYISYSGAYGATLINNVLTKQYPLVSFDVPALVANASTIETAFKGTGVTLAAPNATVPTLAGLFKNNADEFGITGPALFGGDYPIEAIVGVTWGTVTADSLTSVVTRVSGNTENSAPVLLLENLLAAGKVSAATLADGGGTGSPTFAVGDSLSVFVRYTLSKTRTFEIDGASAGGTGTFSLGGTVITDVADASETYTLTKMVEWKFVQ